MHRLLHVTLKLFSTGLLISQMVFYISGQGNITEDITSAIIINSNENWSETFPSEESFTYQNHFQSENFTNNSYTTENPAVTLERQKKEDLFGRQDTVDVKGLRYRPRNNIAKKRIRITTSTIAPNNLTTKFIGPRIERIIERFVITAKDSTVTPDMEEINTPIIVSSTTRGSTTFISTSKNKSTGITSENFDEIVLGSSRIWVIQFYSTACSGCAMSLNKLMESKRKVPNEVNYATINVANDHGFIERFKLVKLPYTKIFYPKGYKRMEQLESIAEEVNDESIVKTNKTITDFRKVVKLKFSSNLTLYDRFMWTTDVPLMRIPAGEPISESSNQIKMKNMESNSTFQTLPTNSDADTNSVNEALHVLIVYAVSKRILMFILAHFANAFANLQEVHRA